MHVHFRKVGGCGKITGGTWRLCQGARDSSAARLKTAFRSATGGAWLTSRCRSASLVWCNSPTEEAHGALHEPTRSIYNPSHLAVKRGTVFLGTCLAADSAAASAALGGSARPKALRSPPLGAPARPTPSHLGVGRCGQSKDYVDTCPYRVTLVIPALTERTKDAPAPCLLQEVASVVAGLNARHLHIEASTQRLCTAPTQRRCQVLKLTQARLLERRSKPERRSVANGRNTKAAEKAAHITNQQSSSQARVPDEQSITGDNYWGAYQNEKQAGRDQPSQGWVVEKRWAKGQPSRRAGSNFGTTSKPARKPP